VDGQDKSLSIQGRKVLVPYDGPLPERGGIIALDDGRSLRVLEVLYQGSLSSKVKIKSIVIRARWM
jgi:hypothetical protein